MEKSFNRRCKICPEHARASEVVIDGCHMRFCQQCNRFHDLQEFEGNCRGCRVKLQRHNKRRAVKFASSVMGNTPAQCCKSMPSTNAKEANSNISWAETETSIPSCTIPGSAIICAQKEQPPKDSEGQPQLQAGFCPSDDSGDSTHIASVGDPDSNPGHVNEVTHAEGTRSPCYTTSQTHAQPQHSYPGSPDDALLPTSNAPCGSAGQLGRVKERFVLARLEIASQARSTPSTTVANTSGSSQESDPPCSNLPCEQDGQQQACIRVMERFALLRSEIARQPSYKRLESRMNEAVSRALAATHGCGRCTAPSLVQSRPCANLRSHGGGDNFSSLEAGVLPRPDDATGVFSLDNRIFDQLIDDFFKTPTSSPKGAPAQSFRMPAIRSEGP